MGVFRPPGRAARGGGLDHEATCRTRHPGAGNVRMQPCKHRDPSAATDETFLSLPLHGRGREPVEAVCRRVLDPTVVCTACCATTQVVTTPWTWSTRVRGRRRHQ